MEIKRMMTKDAFKKNVWTWVASVDGELILNDRGRVVAVRFQYEPMADWFHNEARNHDRWFNPISSEIAVHGPLVLIS